MKQWIFLSVAIVSEVIGTSALKATGEFTRLWPSVIVVFSYFSAFYFLTLTLRTIPIGIAYAIWSGVGVALITLVGWLFYKQTLDVPAFVGITLIVAGVVVLNVFSRAVPH